MTVKPKNQKTISLNLCHGAGLAKPNKLATIRISPFPWKNPMAPPLHLGVTLVGKPATSPKKEVARSLCIDLQLHSIYGWCI